MGKNRKIIDKNSKTTDVAQKLIVIRKEKSAAKKIEEATLNNLSTEIQKQSSIFDKPSNPGSSTLPTQSTEATADSQSDSEIDAVSDVEKSVENLGKPPDDNFVKENEVRKVEKYELGNCH